MRKNGENVRWESINSAMSSDRIQIHMAVPTAKYKVTAKLFQNRWSSDSSI